MVVYLRLGGQWWHVWWGNIWTGRDYVEIDSSDGVQKAKLVVGCDNLVNEQKLRSLNLPFLLLKHSLPCSAFVPHSFLIKYSWSFSLWFSCHIMAPPEEEKCLFAMPTPK